MSKEGCAKILSEFLLKKSKLEKIEGKEFFQSFASQDHFLQCF